MGIKSLLKKIVVGVVKNGCCHSSLSILKLAVSQEGFNGITSSWFFDTNSGKLKVALLIFGWWCSKMSMAF